MTVRPDPFTDPVERQRVISTIAESNRRYRLGLTAAAPAPKPKPKPNAVVASAKAEVHDIAAERRIRRRLARSAKRAKTLRLKNLAFSAMLASAAADNKPDDVLSYEQVRQFLWNSQTKKFGVSKSRVAAIVASGALPYAGLTASGGKPRATGVLRRDLDAYNSRQRALALTAADAAEVEFGFEEFEEFETTMGTITVTDGGSVAKSLPSVARALARAKSKGAKS